MIIENLFIYMSQGSRLNTYDLLIIGGASAGLTAGIYASRKKMNAVILTKQIGGQSLMTDSIENYPGFEKISGFELINKMKKQIDNYGMPVKEGVEIEKIEKKDDGIFLIKTKTGEEFETKTIIIATGKAQRRLDIPGGKEFENRGIVYCSTCDAPLFGGKDVVIIGGGNSALESAMDLDKYATKIYILVRSEKIRGDEFMVEKLKKNPKIEFIFNAQPTEIKGDKMVEKIIYQDKVSGGQKELAVSGVFVNIGWIPKTEFVAGFVDLNEYGEIKIDCRTNETSVKGIFAAGDCTDLKYKQCIIASGEGAKAALSAYEYLNKIKI